MTGPDTIFEGEFGLLQSVTGPFELPDRAWRSTDLMIKRYPAQVYTQTAIEAAILLSSRVETEDIKRVDVSTFKRAADSARDQHCWAPATRETADHSLPYVVSAALKDGDLTPLQFDPAHLSDTRLFDLMQKVAIHEDPDLSRQFPSALPARLKIECYSGKVEEADVLVPFGHPKRPMDRASVEAKFLALSTPTVGAAAAGDLLNGLRHFEHLDDLSPIAEILGAGAANWKPRQELNVGK
jgi:2-methylcitrate dehydratase